MGENPRSTLAWTSSSGGTFAGRRPIRTAPSSVRTTGRTRTSDPPDGVPIPPFDEEGPRVEHASGTEATAGRPVRRSLEGQVALVTGASRGIGLRLAGALSARGAKVAGTARTLGALQAALGAVSEASGTATLALAGDVADRASVEAVVAETTRVLGPVDLLINNAGLIDEAEVPVWEADVDQWWSVVTSHVRGAQLTIAAVVPQMVRRGSGRVVNLASGMGTRAEPDYSAYSVGKAAQMRLTEALDLSLQGTGALAFNIAPGLVRTDMTASMPKWADHTGWTPPERVVDLVCAVADGELDAWHGRFLRAGVDDPAAMASREPSGADRQLRLRPFGPDDPLA